MHSHRVCANVRWASIVGGQIAIPLLASILVIAGFTNSSPLYAQGAAAEHGSRAAIEEVVVTARKREESLQSVSAAVTAIGGNTLQQFSTESVRDLQNIIPNLNFAEGNNGTTRIRMRGLGNTSVFANEDPDVAMHVDGAVISRPEIQTLSFFDLERIEVLRGPQGTLYGRNTVAGSINLITAKPTEKPSGYVRLEGGRYYLGKVSAALSGPLTENVLGRVAVQADRRDGYATNIATGNDAYEEEGVAVRAHLQVHLSDDVKFLLTGEYADTDQSTASSFLRVNFPGGTDPRLESAGVGGFSDPGSRDLAGDFDPFVKHETWSVTGTLDWELTDQISLKNILNYRDADFDIHQDLDNSSVRSGANTVSLATASQFATTTGFSETFSEELQLHYDGEFAGRKLDAIGGLYYFTEDYDFEFLIGFNEDATLEADGSPRRIVAGGVGTTDAWAGFWNITYGFTESLALRVGGRYTHEKREIDNFLLVRPVIPGFGLCIAAVCGFTVLDLQDGPADGDQTTTEYTNEAGLDWQVTDDVLLYYTFTQGFKAGAGILGQLSSPIGMPTTIDNHEVGLKSQIFDGRVTFNLAAYTAEVKDVQLDQIVADPTAPDGVSTQFRNASAVDVDGVEIDATWAITDQLRVAAAAAFMDAEFGPFLTQNPIDPAAVLTPATAFVQVEGNRTPLSPKVKFNIRGEYDFTIPNGAVVTLGVNVGHTGKQYFSEFNEAPLVEGSYTLVDASLSYESSDGHWTGAIWGKNLTDEFALGDATALGGPRIIVQRVIPPLTWGVNVGYRF